METKRYFADAHYGYVILAVLLSALSHLIRAYRWNFMLEPLGYSPKLANNFMAVSVAYLMNIFIPKSGEVSRAVILNKYEKVPFEKGFGTIVSERIVDLIFLLFFTAIALAIKFDVLYKYLLDGLSVRILYIVIIAILVLGISVAVFIKFSKSNIHKKVKKFIFGLKEGVFSILKMRQKGAFLLFSILIWALYLLSFYTALQALPATANISLGTIIITFVVGSFTFAFTNSGFGTYPAAIAGILTIFGIAKTLGIAFGWIVWISNITSIVLFGIISLIFLPLYNRKQIGL